MTRVVVLGFLVFWQLGLRVLGNEANGNEAKIARRARAGGRQDGELCLEFEKSSCHLGSELSSSKPSKNRNLQF